MPINSGQVPRKGGVTIEGATPKMPRRGEAEPAARPPQDIHQGTKVNPQTRERESYGDKRDSFLIGGSGTS